LKQKAQQKEVRDSRNEREDKEKEEIVKPKTEDNNDVRQFFLECGLL